MKSAEAIAEILKREGVETPNVEAFSTAASHAGPDSTSRQLDLAGAGAGGSTGSKCRCRPAGGRHGAAAGTKAKCRSSACRRCRCA